MSEPKIAARNPVGVELEAGDHWWCACGLSAHQPMCDGSHKGTGLGPKQVEITEAQTVAWCACKHSKNMPFCDGTHSRIGFQGAELAVKKAEG